MFRIPRIISGVFALMKMLEYPAIVQMQVEFLVRRVRRHGQGNGKQSGFAIGKREIFRIE